MVDTDTLPAGLRQQLLEVEVENSFKVEDSDFFTPGDSEVAALTGGKMKQTTKHPLGAGFMLIYDSDTGEPRPVMRYMAAKFLAKQRNGKPAFTLKPTKEYKLGGFMCYLHPDHPERELLREMGLDETKDCGYGSDRPPAAHLASAYHRDRHMEKRHKDEWASVLSHRAEAERADARRMQQEQIDAMREMAAAASGQPMRRGPGRPRKDGD